MESSIVPLSVKVRGHQRCSFRVLKFKEAGQVLLAVVQEPVGEPFCLVWFCLATARLNHELICVHDMSVSSQEPVAISHR